MMRVGIDFDNTIICYDTVFNKVGVDQGLLPENLPVGKGFVRDYLKSQGNEKEWIWLQGYVYGKRLCDANIYEGVQDFLSYCRSQKIECFIISHKTVYPYSGDKHNLRTAALNWIKEQKLMLDTFFESTKEEKIKRIADLECSFFIDDLPEFLALPGFPEGMTKIFFDPLKIHSTAAFSHKYTNSWHEILSVIKNES